MRKIAVVSLGVLACLVPGFSQQPSSSVDSVLVVGGVSNQVGPDGILRKLSSAEFYDPVSATFTRVGWMTEGRDGHTATLLHDGRVLITGGDDQSTNHPTSTAEIFDPELGLFRRVGDMHSARVGHTATLLADGTVLVTGGVDSDFIGTKTAELFDPNTLEFTLTAEMHVERTGHTATLLRDGRVLIAGGYAYGIGRFLDTGELYHPTTHKFTHTGPMVDRRTDAAATRLPDGRVFIAGGGALVNGCRGCSIASAEIYDPIANRFTSAGEMQYSRSGHIAVLLRNGTVLIAGGSGHALSESTGGILDSAELFHPKSLRFTSTGRMTLGRFDHAATLLNNGMVLVTGGSIDAFTVTNTTELYDPITRSFQASGSMKAARAGHSSSRISARP